MTDKEFVYSEHGAEHLHTPAPQRYIPTTLFRATAVIFVLAGVWMGSEVWLNSNAINLFIFLGLAAISFSLVMAAFSSVEYDGKTITYRLPMRTTRRINHNQIVSAELAGRRNRALVLIYHPQDKAGRIETENILTINFVPLNDQLDLLEQLGGGTTEERGTGDGGRTA